MKKLSKFTALLLACSTLFSCLIFSAGAQSADSFTDIDATADYYEAVAWAIEKGYMKGTGGNSFSPDKTLTRAQFATLMASFCAADLSSYTGKTAFKDVRATDWFAATSAWAADNGIMNGTGGGNFSPNTVITRQQIAVLLKNYANANSIYLEYQNEQVRTMDRGDARAAAWAREACDYAYKVGFIPLDENNRQYPTQLVTRADAAKFLYEFSRAIDKTKEPNDREVIVYYNPSAQGNSLEELAGVDICNMFPCHADGQAKTIAESALPAVESIRKSTKNINPDLKFLIGIAVNSGTDIERWLYPYSNCDDFAAKAVELVKKYNLDGVDFDYEFPTGNIPQANLEYFLTCLRSRLDKLSQSTGKDYIITMALPGGGWAFSLYEDMGELQHYLDYINFMEYDLRSEAPWAITYNHCALYDNPASGYVNASAMTDITWCLEAGVAREKIVIGVGAYTQEWHNVTDFSNGGMFAKGTNLEQCSGLNAINWMLNYNDPSYNIYGWFTHWDDVSKAVSMYNPREGKVRSFDDLRSTKEKCLCVNEYNLGGIMVFPYQYSTGIGFYDMVQEVFNSAN